MQQSIKKLLKGLGLTKRCQSNLMLKQMLKLKPAISMATAGSLHTVTQKLPNRHWLVTPACYAEFVNH